MKILNPRCFRVLFLPCELWKAPRAAEANTHVFLMTIQASSLHAMPQAWKEWCWPYPSQVSRRLKWHCISVCCTNHMYRLYSGQIQLTNLRYWPTYLAELFQLTGHNGHPECIWGISIYYHSWAVRMWDVEINFVWYVCRHREQLCRIKRTLRQGRNWFYTTNLGCCSKRRQRSPSHPNQISFFPWLLLSWNRPVALN